MKYYKTEFLVGYYEVWENWNGTGFCYRRVVRDYDKILYKTKIQDIEKIPSDWYELETI